MAPAHASVLRLAHSHEGRRSLGGADGRSEDMIKSKIQNELLVQVDTLRTTVAAARSVAATFKDTSDALDSRLEEVAKTLDATEQQFNSLTKSVKECLQICNNATKKNTPLHTAPQPPSHSRSREADGPQTHVAASVYLALEAITHTTRAERGAIMLYAGKKMDELHSVATVGFGRQAVLKLPASVGVCGAVFGSGIAVNQVLNSQADKAFDTPVRQPNNAFLTALPNQPASHHARFRCKGMLCFPIPNFTTSGVLGVLQLQNKNRGTESFTTSDEDVCFSGAKIMSYLLKRYPVEWLGQVSFSPSVLHSVVPWEPPVQCLSTSKLPAPILKHDTRQLIYRTAQSGQYVRQKLMARRAGEQGASAVGACASLSEVDSYIQNLEECWKRSVSLNMEYERQQEGRLYQMKQMRQEAKRDRSTIVTLQDTVNMQNAETDCYRGQYDTIKKDLQLLLDVKTGRRPIEEIV